MSLSGLCIIEKTHSNSVTNQYLLTKCGQKVHFGDCIWFISYSLYSRACTYVPNGSNGACSKGEPSNFANVLQSEKFCCFVYEYMPLWCYHYLKSKNKLSTCSNKPLLNKMSMIIHQKVSSTERVRKDCKERGNILKTAGNDQVWFINIRIIVQFT